MRFCALFVCLAMSAVSCQSGLSEEAVDEKLAQQEIKFQRLLVKKGLIAATDMSQESSGHTEELNHLTVSDDAQPYVSSLQFLNRLDRIMASYDVIVPLNEDLNDMMRCVTDWEMTWAPELKKVKRVLAQKQGRTEESHRQIEAELRRKAWKQYRIDYRWENREELGFPVLACLCGGQWKYGQSFNSRRRCNSRKNCQWRLRGRGKSGGRTYDRKPELMTRIDAAGITIPERFHCQVANANDGFDAYLGEPYLKVSCTGLQELNVEVRVYGKQDILNRGDVISVPLRNALRDPQGVLFKEANKDDTFWVISANQSDIKTSKLESCPSRASIIEAAR